MLCKYCFFFSKFHSTINWHLLGIEREKKLIQFVNNCKTSEAVKLLCKNVVKFSHSKDLPKVNIHYINAKQDAVVLSPQLQYQRIPVQFRPSRISPKIMIWWEE